MGGDFEDELRGRIDADETRRHVRLTGLVLKSMVIAIALTVALSFLEPANDIRATIGIQGGTSLLVGLGFVLHRRGHSRAAAWLISWLFWFVVCVSMWLYGGLESEMGTAYIIAVMVAGATLGGRPALLFAVLSIASSGIVLAAQLRGWLPAPLMPPSPWNAWISVTISLLLAAFLLSLSLRSLREAVVRGYVHSLETARVRERMLEEAQSSTWALKVAQEEIQEREATLRSLVENAPDYIAVADRDHRITFVNRADRIPRWKLIGSQIEEVVGEQYREEMFEAVESVLKTRNPARVDFSARVDEPPELRHYAARLGPILRDDDVSGVTMIIEDVTDRRRDEEIIRRRKEELEEIVRDRTRDLAAANQQLSQDLVARRQVEEELRAASMAKTTFLAKVSHELRSPLNAILGFSRLLRRDGRLDAGQRRRAEIIERSGAHLLALIDDILDVSRIEAGKVEVAPTAISFKRFVDEFEEVYLDEASLGSRRVLVRRADDLPDHISVDVAKLRQVLANLVSNALKHAKSGDVEVAIARREQRLHFSVRDWGDGIPEAELASIFEPFHQHQGTSEDSVEGVGLGLAICQQMVGLMGGVIAVTSEVGRGSTFRFDVPYADAPAGLPSELPLPRGRLRPAMHSPRVLVVEDSRVNAEVLVALLEPLGLDVQVALDGVQGVSLCRAMRPHLVWMDVQMPNLDGLEATRRIRALDLQPRPVIIALSASAMAQDRERVLQVGCDDFMAKPFDEQQVFEALHRYVGLEWDTHDVSDADTPLGSVGIPADEALDHERMARISAELRAALERATIGLDTEAMQSAIEAIGASDRVLARQLQFHFERFQFREILSTIATAEVGS